MNGDISGFVNWLLRVSCEEDFTTEAQSSQSSENFLNQKLFTPRPPRLRGAISEPCFTRKSEDPINSLIKEELLWQTSEGWVNVSPTATIIRSRIGSKNCVTNKSRASASREMTLNVNSWRAGWAFGDEASSRALWERPAMLIPTSKWTLSGVICSPTIFVPRPVTDGVISNKPT